MPPKKGSKADQQAATAPAPAAAASAAAASDGKGKKASSSAASSTPPIPGATAAAPFGFFPSGAPRTEAWFPKSKRAVKANGGVVGARPDRQIGEWVVKEYQMLPKQLLQEYLQKQKRPRAIFPTAACTVANRSRVRVVLPDPKGKAEKDITLVPKQDYSSRMEAEEYAALLALKHLTPTLPLERKFPEPFATAWQSFGKVLHEEAPSSAAPAAAAASSSSAGSAAAPASAAPVQSLAPIASSMFVSQAERLHHQEEQRKKQNARENRQESRERSYAKVFMSEANRTFIHDMIRHMQQLNPISQQLMEEAEAASDVNAEPNEDDDDDEDGEATEPRAPSVSPPAAASAVDSELLKQLEKLGFARTDAQQSLKLSGGSDLNSALDYLMLNLPEHRLPAQFDPRGKQLEVVHHERDPFSLFFGPGRMAIPKSVCEAALAAANGDMQAALFDVFQQLYAHLCPAEFAATSAAEAKPVGEVDECISEELTALESIFEKDFERIGARAWSVKIASPNLSLSLEFLVPPACIYPAQCPVVLVRCDHLSAAQRLQLTAQVAKHIFSNELLGNPLTFELHSWFLAEIEELLRSSNLSLPKTWVGKQKMLTDADRKNLASMPAPSSAASSAALSSASTVTTAANSSAASSASSESEWQEDDDANQPVTEETAVTYRPRPPQNNAAVSAQLARAWSEQKASSEYKKMLQVRQTLPVFKSRDLIVDTCGRSQVVVLSGATGSGKSTQLPQFLLDVALESSLGSITNILVTQPRRISAIGLAERVSDERAEKCGQTIGYRIRGENKVSAATRLTFVTTGVLLRQLTSRTALEKLSHIIIDEVHERSVEIDFLLLILKQLLPLYPSLKLVLMSATLDAEVFSAYFGGTSKCPVISVEGRTFPVTDVYLEDILRDMEYVPDHKARLAGLKADELEQRMTSVREGLHGDYSDTVIHSLATINPSVIDFKLLEALIWWIIDHRPLGGILVFLPGVYEITKLCGNLERAIPNRETREKYWVIPLHGSLSSSNQQRVFSKAPFDTRKIVLATNIAETSITVEDILYVIDSGRVKQTEFDAVNKMSSLVETFVSKASANQRRGRAGRVKPGTCFRMQSSLVFNDFASHQLPELHRTALDHVCLQIKLLRLDKNLGREGLQKLLAMCVQPPAPLAVSSAISSLQEAQALDSSQSLTPLGSHLARLPIDNVKIGKLLLLSAMFGCVTAMVRIAAILGGKPIFLSPFDAREEADRKKMEFARGAGKSDAITMLRAYNGWVSAKAEGGHRAANEYAKLNFLSVSGLDTASQLADTYLKGLQEIGFVSRGGGGGGGGRGPRQANNDSASSSTSSLLDDQSDNVLVLSALLTGAFHPNLLSVECPADVYTKVANGAVPIAQDSRLFKFFKRNHDGSRTRVFLHPRSVNFKNQAWESPWITYLSMQQSEATPASASASASASSSASDSGKTQVFDCHQSHPYALMMFGSRLDTDLAKGLIIVDGHIHFRAPARIAALVRALRQYLNATLEAKIKNPALEIRQSPVIAAILRIITTNGF